MPEGSETMFSNYGMRTKFPSPYSVYWNYCLEWRKINTFLNNGTLRKFVPSTPILNEQLKEVL